MSFQWATAGDYSTMISSNVTFTNDYNLTSTRDYIKFNANKEWLPNSCLHEKYLPTWHLVRSYEVD